MWRLQALIKRVCVTQRFAVLPCKLSFQHCASRLSPTCALTHLVSILRINLCVCVPTRSRLIPSPSDLPTDKDALALIGKAEFQFQSSYLLDTLN